MSETPQQVVARELALWRLAEAERRRAYWTELQEAQRRFQDAAIARKRAAKDEYLAEMRRLQDESEVLYLERYEKQRRRDAQLTKAFPRITWRDIWLALWN